MSFKILILLLLLNLVGCSQQAKQSPSRVISQSQQQQSGLASYYANKYHGRRTASGERFNQQALTAAHKTLPFGSLVRVTNLENGKSVVVKINDRGPFVRGRVIDLSAAAFNSIGNTRAGLLRVNVQHIR